MKNNIQYTSTGYISLIPQALRKETSFDLRAKQKKEIANFTNQDAYNVTKGQSRFGGLLR